MREGPKIDFPGGGSFGANLAVWNPSTLWFNKDVQKTLRILIVLLSILGTVVSALALQVHYSNKVEPCDINARWDCGIVNHSSYSTIHGVPVAAVGIAGYLLIGLLALLGKRGWTLLLTLIGLGYALYLSQVEHSILQVWCLYCVISQCTIALITIFAAVSLVVRPKK
ncbi:MAG: vitamin K epoxide reductase family protein [Terriglobia bacterium]|nr:vitamin K epoxide reductase family protein [Terriglobia bacterium]